MRGGEKVSDEKTKLQDSVAKLKAWQDAMKAAAEEAAKKKAEAAEK
jgi:hypothetical protein